MLTFIHRRNFLFTHIIIIVQGLVLYGCSRPDAQQRAQEGQVVAKINSYQMSVADFKEQVGFILASKYLAAEPNAAKEELLDELITRNLILQEAQRQNLDKERAFMKEIERYWEESLLKVLLKRKSQDIMAGIRVEDSEVLNEYMRMKRRILAQLVILSDQKRAQELSGAAADNFAQLKETVKEAIVSEEAPRWWVAGELPQGLEEALFALKAQEISPALKLGNNWAVIKVIQEEEQEIGPFESIAGTIRKSIQKRKQEAALAAWTKDLRAKAVININKDTLQRIDLE